MTADQIVGFIIPAAVAQETGIAPVVTPPPQEGVPPEDVPEGAVVVAPEGDAPAGAHQLPPADPGVDIPLVHEVEHAGADHSVEYVLAAALLVLILLLVWKGRKAILEVLDSRAARIRSDLADAEMLRQQAQAALQDAERRHAEATEQAGAILAAARAEGERIRQQAATDLEAAIQRREAMAANRIAQAEAAAVAEIRALAGDLAVRAARQVVSEQLAADPARRSALIDDAIAALPGKLN